MEQALDKATLSLMNTYARYFASEFPVQVLGQLSASMPIDREKLTAYISKNLSASLNVNTVNPVTRFLCELATFAIDQKIPNPESLEVYQVLKDMPSMHHDDINKMVFESAQLYRQTLDVTVLNVLARDASQAAETITLAAQSRLSDVKVGGNLHFFNWGILSNGMWLNQALTRAYDMANIFHPDAKVSNYYAKSAFDMARKFTPAPSFPNRDPSLAYGSFQMLLNQADQNIVSQEVALEGWEPVEDLLFRHGPLMFALTRWEEGLRNPKGMIDSVNQLSTLATVLPHLIDVAKQMDDDVLVDKTVVNRLDDVYNVVTLALAGYEALRETNFNDSLILGVESLSNDPIVEVYVNEDTMSAFRMGGGQDDDVLKLGQHLDPRKGVPTPGRGWPVDWALKRRETVVPQVAASELEMIAKMRSNDSAVIRDIASKELKSVVQSYYEARHIDVIPTHVNQKIEAVARSVASQTGTESFSLETEVMGLLLTALDNPFVAQVANGLLENATDENAKALAIASVALQDATALLTGVDHF